MKIHRLTDTGELSSLLRERYTRSEDVSAAVAEIVEGVTREGDAAVARFTRAFDGVCLEPEEFRVPDGAIASAAASIPQKTYAVMKKAAGNIRRFHKRQMPKGWEAKAAGVSVGERVTPLSRVGIYVPGGTAGTTPLVSTVLMNAIPADVAGVDQVVMCSPPRKDKDLNPHLLAAAALAGVDEIYQVGGAQAIAAMACGTKTIARVDKIVGPGNAYVTTAKRIVYGEVDIDSLAGPSEIVVLGDGSVDPRFIAADIAAQTEHNPDSLAILITMSEREAKEVLREVDALVAGLPREAFACRSLETFGGIFIADSLEKAVEVANLIAPEHLSFAVKEPRRLLSAVRNAGAIFLGGYSPVAAGDYWAGPNHVLPTFSTARYASPLSVRDFVKWSSVIDYSAEAITRDAESIAILARVEGLEAHARSALIRKGDKK